MYVKDQQWAHFTPPKSASWAIKYICKGRQEIMSDCGSTWLSASQYQTADLYIHIHGNKETLHWCNDVWAHYNIPKHNFIYWLVMLNRLQTRDKLVKIGVCEEETCMLCDAGKQDQHHLF